MLKRFKIYLTAFFLLLSISVLGQEEEQLLEGENLQEVSNATQESVTKLKTRVEQILNFFAMYSATYAGEHDEYINQLKDNLVQNENIHEAFKSLIEEISLSGGMLEKAVSDFNGQTGLHLYSIGEIEEAFANDKFSALFNRLSASKNVYYNSPAFILHAKVSGNKASGWSASISIETQGIDANALASVGGKAELEKLYNSQLASVYRERSSVRKAVRNALIYGSNEVASKIQTALHPNPYFNVNGEKYGSGSTVKLFSHGGTVQVELLDKDLNGMKVKRWTGALGSTHKDSSYVARIDTQNPGQLQVTTATKGGKSYSLQVDIRQVPSDFDNLLREVLKVALDSVMARAERGLTTKRDNTDELYAEYKKHNEELHADIQQMQLPQGWTLSYEASSSTVATANDADYSYMIPQNSFYNNLTKGFKNYITALKGESLKEARYIMAVTLVKPENFDKLLGKMRADLPTIAGRLLGKLILGEGKAEMKEFLITHLEKMFDELMLDALGEDGKVLYSLMNAGVPKDQIRTWVADLLANKIVDEL